MKLEGGCFCGAVRYEAEGDPVMKGQCYCRQCQYFAGGAPNIFLALPLAGFKVTKGTPTTFKRADAAVLPAERAFCPTCGVQLTTHADALPEVIFLKVGSLDEPARFDGADVAIFTCDKQPFHQIPPGAATFDKLPPL